MPNISEDKRRLFVLKQQLQIIILIESDLGLSKREQQEAIDNILDEMIIILKRIRKHEQSDERE